MRRVASLTVVLVLAGCTGSSATVTADEQTQALAAVRTNWSSCFNVDALAVGASYRIVDETVTGRPAFKGERVVEVVLSDGAKFWVPLTGSLKGGAAVGNRIADADISKGAATDPGTCAD